MDVTNAIITHWRGEGRKEVTKRFAAVLNIGALMMM